MWTRFRQFSVSKSSLFLSTAVIARSLAEYRKRCIKSPLEINHSYGVEKKNSHNDQKDVTEDLFLQQIL